MDNCSKCGSDKIDTKYFKKGELITSSSFTKVDNEFVRSSEYDFYYKLTAEKEHLKKHCTNCSHKWRENIAAAKV